MLTLDLEQYLTLYQQMLKIRLFEEQVNELYQSAKMPGLAHLYSGEEAVAVGVCEALRQDDYITSTHRGHGHCLAKGARVDRMFAELLGKEAGYCRGKGGSMHIADQDTGNLGANAIVGGGIPIATDVHALSDLHDPYNRDFLAAADILFMSHEHLPTDPATWAARLLEQYHPRVFVIGLGKEGALLAVPGDRFIGRLPAVTARPVVNTIGAGDALFSAFLHSYLRSADPYDALKRATLFAAHKIGETGAAKGFLSESALNALYQQHGAAMTFQRYAA